MIEISEKINIEQKLDYLLELIEEDKKDGELSFPCLYISSKFPQGRKVRTYRRLLHLVNNEAIKNG